MLALTGCQAAMAGSRVTLADHGKSNYRIVLDADAAPAVRHAGAELADYLQQATGAQFSVVSVDGGQLQTPVIRLRVDPGAAGEKSEAFRIAAQGRNLSITGNTPRAVLYGVYRLLEDKVGLHWFDDDGADVPTHQRLRFTVSDQRYAPRFNYREVFFAGADDPAFAAHNRLNGRFGHRLHKRMNAAQGGDRAILRLSIFDLVPRDRYRKSHPEYYAGGQLRFADPGVRKAAQQQLRKAMASWESDPAYLLIPHADRETYYHGGADGELIKQQGAPSAAYVDFVRDLAKTVKEKHPDVTVLAQGYLWSRKPPETQPLPDNMGVMLSGIKRDFSRPITAPGNRTFLDDLDGWAKLTSHIVVWDYVTDFAGYIQPYPNLHTLAANLRALAKRDAVEGVFAQGAYNSPGGALAQLRTWLLARLLWNPKRDPQALIKTFLTGYYGPAAPQIKQYIAALKAAAQRWPGKLGDKAPANAGYFDKRFLRRADQLFAQAAKAVQGQPTYLRRVQTSRIGVDYAVLANRIRLNNAAWIKPEQRRERLRHNLEQAQVSAYREGGGADVESLMQTLAIKRHKASRLAVCAYKPASDCRVIEDDALHLAGGGARLVADAVAGDGGAVTMPGDTETWGIQLPLQKLLPKHGRWHIYVRARAEPATGSGKIALLIGVYPGDHERVASAKAAGASYHSLRVPGSYARGDADYLWVAPPGDKNISRILVDRVVAVAAEGD